MNLLLHTQRDLVVEISCKCYIFKLQRKKLRFVLYLVQYLNEKKISVLRNIDWCVKHLYFIIIDVSLKKNHSLEMLEEMS